MAYESVSGYFIPRDEGIVFVYISNSQRGTHAPLVGYGDIMLNHAIFWWGLFRDQVNRF